MMGVQGQSPGGGPWDEVHGSSCVTYLKKPQETVSNGFFQCNVPRLKYIKNCNKGSFEHKINITDVLHFFQRGAMCLFSVKNKRTRLNSYPRFGTNCNTL